MQPAKTPVCNAISILLFVFNSHSPAEIDNRHTRIWEHDLHPSTLPNLYRLAPRHIRKQDWPALIQFPVIRIPIPRDSRDCITPVRHQPLHDPTRPAIRTRHADVVHHGRPAPVRRVIVLDEVDDRHPHQLFADVGRVRGVEFTRHGDVGY